MGKKDVEKRCDQLIEVLQITFRKKSEWSEPRAWTTWGTKTRRGVRGVIERIMYEDDSSSELLDVCKSIHKTIGEALADNSGENISVTTLLSIQEKLSEAIEKAEEENE